MIESKEEVRIENPLKEAPLRDYGFHKLFNPNSKEGRDTILLLLYLVTGIDGTTIEELSPERYQEKKPVSDLRVKVDGNLYVVIEMQGYADDKYIKRMAYYGSSEIVLQLEEDDDYSKLENVVIISLVRQYNFKTYKPKDKLENYEMIHGKIQKHGAYPDEFRVYLEHYKHEEIDFSKYDRENMLRIVVRLLYNENNEGFMNNVKKYISEKEGKHMEQLESLLEQIQAMNSNQIEKLKLIDRYWDELRYQSGLESKKEEGIEIGEKRGFELAINVICKANEGLSNEEISQLLGVNVQKVEDILYSYNKKNN